MNDERIEKLVARYGINKAGVVSPFGCALRRRDFAGAAKCIEGGPLRGVWMELFVAQGLGDGSAAAEAHAALCADIIARRNARFAKR